MTGTAPEFFLPIERALWVATIVAETILVLRLHEQGLIWRYPFFTLFLCVEVIASVFLMQIGYHSYAYARAFRLYNSIGMPLKFAVAAEFYERMCTHFPGIGKFRFAMAGAVVTAAGAMALVSFRPDLCTTWGFPHTLVLVIRGYLSEILACALILTWLLLRRVVLISTWFAPNIARHWLLLTVFFSTTALHDVGVLWFGAGKTVHPFDTAMFLIHLGCLSAWVRLFHASGEIRPAEARCVIEEVANAACAGSFAESLIAPERAIRHAQNGNHRASDAIKGR